MRTLFLKLSLLILILQVIGCVDPYEPTIRQSVNTVVVDGTLTNLAETQVVRLSRSLTISGQPGNVPLTGARVEVVVDSSQVIPLPESPEKGAYQLPSDFRGEVGHSYQLRFQLSDGTRYESTAQVMAAAPPITGVTARFNPTSLPPNPEGYTAAHDFFLDTQDPADERNYYKWDWALYEKQAWCRTCYEGVYAVNNVYLNQQEYRYESGDELFEECWFPPYYYLPLEDKTFDYTCRSQCWEIIQRNSLNLFDDALTNGGSIQGRKVAQVPYYQYIPCLVEIRQLALTKEAYRFYKLVETQTQNTGGLADTPPVAPLGNVHNVANPKEFVVGFFTAAGVSTLRHWLDRKDAFGKARGLFQSLNGRDPQPEPPPPTGPNPINGGPARPPTALCAPNYHRTPFKPEGWRE